MEGNGALIDMRWAGRFAVVEGPTIMIAPSGTRWMITIIWDVKRRRFDRTVLCEVCEGVWDLVLRTKFRVR